MNIFNQSSFEGHKGAVYTVCPSFQYGIFYSGAADGFLVEWNIKQAETGKVLFQLESPIYAICILDNANEWIAVGTANGYLHILDTKSNQIRHKIIAHQGAIFDLKLIDNLLFSVAADGQIIAWNVNDYSKKFQLNFSDKSARAIVKSLKSNCFYVGYSDFVIREFEGTDKPVLKAELIAHTQSVFSLAVHPQTGNLVSGGRDAHLKYWQNNKMQKSIPAHLSHINSLCFQPAGNLLLSGSMDKTIKIWDAHDLTLLKVIDQTKMKAHKHSVNKVAWMSDNTFLTCGDDRMIYLWEIEGA
jgi:WD repeat-containing protein 61